MNKLNEKVSSWKTLLPTVKAHYAIKCNPNTEICKFMLRNGLGFDCASQKEIQTVLDIGATPEDII